MYVTAYLVNSSTLASNIESSNSLGDFQHFLYFKKCHVLCTSGMLGGKGGVGMNRNSLCQ